MKLFIRKHLLLMVVQCLQFFAMILIFWLDGFRDLSLALYVVFLAFFFLVIYLAYDYYRHRQFYKRLSEPLETLDQSLEEIEEAPLSQALYQLLKSQYSLYQQRIQEAEYTQEEHLLFMDRWVHQMKTPLSVIELMAEDLDEPDSSNMREETDRIQTGLNTVLYMARLRTIEQDFHIKPVVLEKIVHEVNQENRRFYIRNQVYPQLQQDKEGITVQTDEKWLFFMISQLINNAVKYSVGKSNKLVISLYERDQSAILEITDFGIGIPDTDIRRIFNAFYTGESGRKYRESTGMGLYLIKKVADYLEHQIEIDSKVNEGTSFRIIFTPSQNLTN